VSEETIAAWQKKLDFFLLQETRVTDSAEKFKLQEDIADAEKKLRELRASQHTSSGQARGHPWLEELFSDTVCSKISRAVRPYAAHSLVSMLRERIPANDAELIRAGRFLVEHQLLATAQTPYCALTGERRAFFPEGEDALWDAVDKKQYARPSRTLAPGEFLQRTLERTRDWYEYFDALRQCHEPKLEPGEIQTLHSIEVSGKGGAIAPQYLIAGLMSYFHEEWSPVIGGYTDVGTKAGMLDRLKASQWICWLVWGPSIPLCECGQWQPALAHQFGYGDENNSLPVYFLGDPAPVLKSLRGASQGDKRAIHVRNVAGRLTWAPFAFGAASSFAPAQARLTAPTPSSANGASEPEACGLLLKLERAVPRNADPKEPAYFTSYIWLMFWVTRAGRGKSLQRLDGEQLPAPTADAAANRELMSAGMLWQDLLPVFVHANIFDAVVLGLQKGTLVENALQLLRRAWESEDKSLEFHLVCASDYSGCGHEIKFPAPRGESLLELLRARVATLRKDDPKFAKSLCLPDPGAGGKRPDEFACFFSACHLPEMVEGYYQFLNDKQSQ
jgi:hypothetical protein